MATGPPRFIEGNHAFYIRDGRVQLAWMLAAIGAARVRIDFEMYIFAGDEAGRLVRDALALAAKRGVRVRLLYDSIGCSNTNTSFFQPIIEAGGIVVEFNPAAPWRLRMSRLGKTQVWQPNARDHRKLLVCDIPLDWVTTEDVTVIPGEPEPMPPPVREERDLVPGQPNTARAALAITGGRNIADEYLRHPIGDGQWRDCGAVILGPVVAELGKMFDSMWFHAEGPDVADLPLKTPRAGELAILPIGSQPGFFNPLQWALTRMPLAVQEELRVSCAYFVPSLRLRRALATTARRTQRCFVMVPKASDVPMVDRASRHLWGGLLAAGVAIFRYSRSILHEKTIVYDRRVTVIGSSNLDPRSFRLNYELSVIIVGVTFAMPIVSGHEADLMGAERYTLAEWKARPFWERLIDWFWSLLRSQL